MHILLIRFSSLGDIVLASSVPKSIKDRWGPKVHLSFLTSEAFAPLLKGVPWIDQLHTISRAKGLAGIQEVLKVVQNIRRERTVDLILDMHGTLRSLAIRLGNWDLPRIFVDKRTLERWLLCGPKIDLLSPQAPKPRKGNFGELVLSRNVADLSGLFNLPLLNRSSLPWSSLGPSFTEEDQFDGKKWGLDLERPYITLAPSASFPEKRWPFSKFFELVERLCQDPRFLHYNFVILAGPEDEFCRGFDPLTERFPGRVINLQGKTSLLESTLILKHGSFCVGNDTGLPHIAESVGVPVVAVLGPTGEEFGYYPHLPQSQTVMKHIWCRPCTTNGKGHCIRSERFCLTTIMVDEVLTAMDTLEQSLS